MCLCITASIALQDLSQISKRGSNKAKSDTWFMIGITKMQLTTWILVFLETLATKTLQHMRSFAENVPKKPH